MLFILVYSSRHALSYITMFFNPIQGIIARRLANRLTIPQLAKLAGCGHETIYRLERGDTRTLHTATVQKLTSALDKYENFNHVY